MNFTYFKFLFINTIKRKPVWITWLLFLLTCISFLIIVPLAAKMNTLQLWANTTMTICQTFLGMTAALFTAVLSINIFKDGNEEGTELIVVSKPITRMKIVLTKFILFGMLCLIVNISAVLISMFTVFLPRTEPKFYWGLIISMFIGNAVSFALFGSIAVLLSAKFAKAGVIITNICLSLVFLIYQALTLFVFRTPARAMADDYITAPSYIVMNRHDDGSYTEEHVVKFTAAPVQKKNHPCTATNWQQMKSYWENNILGNNPTPILNATDWAGQVSLTYLSYNIDQYSLRQAQRMFGISRYYNYDLISPASPEIINGTKHMNWLYCGKNELDLSEYGLGKIYFPYSFGFAGIPPITSTRLRGYTDLIPVGYVKSKEILSQREVYLEKKEWNQYKDAFDAIYNNIFNWTNYADTSLTWESYPAIFSSSNDNIKKYYQLMWHSFKGDEQSVIPEASREALTAKLNCKTVDDFNDRFIQFKYYAFIKAQKEQENALNNVAEGLQKTAYENAKKAWETTAEAWGVKYPEDHPWFMQADSDTCMVVEPGTRTISWNLIEEAWSQEKDLQDFKDLTKEQQINEMMSSTKGVMDRTSAIFDTCCYPREYYLFDSVEKPTRNAKYTGDCHVDGDYWVPYAVSLIAPFFEGREEVGISVATAQPMGQNLQYFYYKTTAKVDYWKYAIIWAIVSISLFTAGAIVYNKYDFK